MVSNLCFAGGQTLNAVLGSKARIAMELHESLEERLKKSNRK